MYDENYQSRLNLQQVCSFFLNGMSNKDFEEGTPEERSKKNTENLYQCLESIRKRILYANEAVLEDKKESKIKTEEMFVNVIMNSEESQELSYEMGFRAGFIFASDVYGH
ncbi:hypothetical protein [Lacrimispora amygdalina]|uniref:hypothetical protein n=1 Tax=Lacrimispora amygdalina TaxID=253257 RepID=UPI000BE35652|nr:hypothetical protein [Lacrimispora amygdalina]